MRDNLSRSEVEFWTEVDKVLFGAREEFLRRTSGPNSPNLNKVLNDEFVIRIKKKDWRSLLALILFTWKLPEEFRFLFLLKLEETIRQLPNEDKWILSHLSSEGSCRSWILLTSKFHSREFFGNILSRLKNLDSLFNTFLKDSNKRKVKEKVFKRGYSDHGSLRESHRWLPKEDFDLTELQNSIERERKSQQDTLSLIKGLIE